MNTKRTPLPWMATGPTGKNMQSYSQPYGVVGTGQYRTTIVCGCFGDIEGGEEAAKENAEFIANACNTHAALVKALQDLRDLTHSLNDEGGIDNPHQSQELIDAHKQADLALEAAGEARTIPAPNLMAAIRNGGTAGDLARGARADLDAAGEA